MSAESRFNENYNNLEKFNKKTEVKSWQPKIQVIVSTFDYCCHETALNKSLEAKWNFLLKIATGCKDFVQPLENMTQTNFYQLSQRLALDALNIQQSKKF